MRNEAEYQTAIARIRADQEFARAQRERLVATGLDTDQARYAMQPLCSFHAQLEEEVEWYEHVRRGDIEPLRSFTQVGRFLIGLRIARGWNQKQLASALGISEAQVSRDERNEYHGITAERIQRILDALGYRLNATVEQYPTRAPIAANEREAANV